MNDLINQHLDIWTSAIASKASAGRGSSDKQTAYGIKKLRELILELAVRGKLVPQDSNDEPVSVLLERMAKEKALLIKEKKIKPAKQLPAVDNEEKFFELPPGWEFVRLNDIGEWGAGATPSRSRHQYYGGNIPWFKSGELTDDYISDSEEHITELALKETSLRYNKQGDVLIAMYGATIGKTAIIKTPSTTNQAVCACTPFNGVYNVFLLTLLKAYKYRFIGMGWGGAQPNISREKIIATVIGLPPLAEQHRIVAKVDELMALCDQLEQQQTDNIAAHQTLVQTLLDTLTQAADAGEFEQAWSRIADHFDTLFTTEASIDQLKQSLLQLAVMGKLVQQDPNDIPAGVLLRNIRKVKKELIATGKINTEKNLPSITTEEKWCELPSGWEWARFSDYALSISTGPFGSMIHQSDYVTNGVPLINPSHMINDEIIPDFGVTVSDEMAKAFEAYSLNEGDIIMARRGEVGRIALVTEKESSWLCGTGSFVLRFSDDVNRHYLKLVFRCDFIRRYLAGEAVGTTMVNLNHGILKKMPFAVPPLAEQYRIVAKVDELMALCDALKARIAAAQTTQLQLADAIVEQAVA